MLQQEKLELQSRLAAGKAELQEVEQNRDREQRAVDQMHTSITKQKVNLIVHFYFRPLHYLMFLIENFFFQSPIANETCLNIG